MSGVVIAVQPDGTVTLSSTQPAVGTAVTATLNDPDGSVSGLTWQWARSPNGTTGWTNISGATSEPTCPLPPTMACTCGRRRATPTRKPPARPPSVVSGAVGSALTEDDLFNRYDANGSGQIEREEAVAAVNDYFDDLITRDQVIRVIQAYLSS